MKSRSKRKSILVAAVIAISMVNPAFATQLSGPPTNWDAYNALAKRFVDAAEASVFAGFQSGIQEAVNFPSDVSIERCEFDGVKRLPTSTNLSPVVSGYDCVMTVFPNGEPAYQILGFFYFNGIEWLLYGPTRASLVVPIDRYENGVTVGTLSGNPGSIRYRGLAGAGGFLNPYDPILGRSNNHNEQFLFGDRDLFAGEKAVDSKGY